MANTPAHVTSATLGHTSASSVLNETFMSNKKSLDKQDKLDFISFNLDLERDFNDFLSRVRMSRCPWLAEPSHLAGLRISLVFLPSGVCQCDYHE